MVEVLLVTLMRRYRGCVPVRKRIGEDVAAQAVDYLNRQQTLKVRAAAFAFICSIACCIISLA